MTIILASFAGIFAILAIYFSFKEEQRSKENLRHEKEIERQLYELGILSGITQKIGYSLNIETVAETLALTVENQFDLSTVSYALILPDKTISIKNYLKENVGLSFTSQVSMIMTSSIFTLSPALSEYPVRESTVNNVPQVNRESYFDAIPQAYFNIPLVINNELVGMFNISSRKKGIYQDADMSFLYKLVNTAQITIGKLKEVIDTEKAKLDSLILSLPSGTIMFEVKGGKFVLSVINQAAKEFLGLYGDTDMAGVFNSFGDKLKIADNIKRVFETKSGMKIDNVKLNGREFTILINPVELKNSPHFIGVSIIMIDMTGEKRIESIKQDFTNMIVHDLRAPATAIKGASSLLLQGNLSDHEEEKMKHIISDSSQDMLSTISKILDVGKIQEGKLAIRKEYADFVAFVKKHVDTFAFAAREKNISVNLEKSEHLPNFKFDAERVGQVINNLISNSLKFTNNGGKIDVKISHQNGEIEVMVSDTGVGIPEDQKSALFTKFGRIRQGLGAGQSTGLGLFISKEIIEAHGGRIWLESKVGEGTKVFFTLPTTDKKEEEESLNLSHFSN